jgi:hypothetical protein
MGGMEAGREPPGRRDSGASGVEVVGQGLVELEVGDGVGLGGIERRSLIEEAGEEIALRWSPGGRAGRGLVGEALTPPEPCQVSMPAASSSSRSPWRRK